MKILVINYKDDNFGDVLIRLCFEKLLAVVMDNLNLPADTYTLRAMALKSIDRKTVSESDLILFAGGGLFGLSYLNFYQYLQEILSLADDHRIPVILSSIGVNNMDAAPDTEEALRELLRHDCIRAISVRENIDLFRRHAGDRQFPIEEVCDPAVWTRFVFHADIEEIRKQPPHSQKLVGINVVRGGLFMDNNRNWGLTAETAYLNALKERLESLGYDYRFYTNGSTPDNNTMLYFAQQYNIPETKLVFVDSTRDLVRAIAAFDRVAAIRMHSSILSYSLGIPCVNLVWNDKVPLFYQKIGRREHSVELEDWTAEKVTELLLPPDGFPEISPDPEYLMSLYRFLYRHLSELLQTEPADIYSYEKIAGQLQIGTIALSEDIEDYRFKIKCGEKRYLTLFKADRAQKAEIKALKEELCQRQKLLEEKDFSLHKLTEALQQQKNQLKQTQSELKKQKRINADLQTRLDRISRHPLVRLYRKFKRTFRKLIKA